MNEIRATSAFLLFRFNLERVKIADFVKTQSSFVVDG